MEQSLVPEVSELLELKESSSEIGLAPQRPRLNDYIEESLAYLKAQADKLPSQRKQPWEPLNKVFLQAFDMVGEL